MKLRIDEQCTGQGRCYSLAPQLLSPDDDGYVTIRGGEIELPQHLAGLAEEIVSSCPEAAISVADE